MPELPLPADHDDAAVFLLGALSAAVLQQGGRIVEAEPTRGTVLVQLGGRLFRLEVAPAGDTGLPPLERKTGR